MDAGEDLEWTRSPRIKEGDRISMVAPVYRRRHWWEFWKPRWIETGWERQTRMVGKIIQVSPAIAMETGTAIDSEAGVVAKPDQRGCEAHRP